MHVFVNGRIVPEEQAVVSVFDRGFLYGDGLFETIQVLNGCPFRWEQHLDRLAAGAKHLGIRLPFTRAALRQALDRLIKANDLSNAILRLTVSRGIGPRGYSPRGADQPTLVMALHPNPSSEPEPPLAWRLITASVRLPAGEPLARFKTCNKLPQILARAEAEEARANEALLLNTQGYIVEGASSNLFWVTKEGICTPPLESGILAGVTRVVVVEVCRAMGVSVDEGNITGEELHQCQGVFLSLSSVGIAEAVNLDGRALPQSPLTARIRAAYEQLLQRETCSTPRTT